MKAWEKVLKSREFKLYKKTETAARKEESWQCPHCSVWFTVVNDSTEIECPFCYKIIVTRMQLRPEVCRRKKRKKE